MVRSLGVGTTFRPAYRGVAGSFLSMTLSVLLAVPAARGASVDAPAGLGAQIRKATAEIAEAEFEEALKTLNQALTEPENTDATLATLYQLQGVTYLYLGREEKAREAFEKLLQADPDFDLPKGTAGKVRRIFEAVKDDVKNRRLKPVKVTHERPAQVQAGQMVDLKANIVDLPPGIRAKLYYRRSGAEGFNSAFFLPTGAAELYQAQIPAFEVPIERSTYAIEYYLEVADGAGRRLAGMGNALAPMSAKVVAPAETAAPAGPAPLDNDAVYKKWWFWTLVGVTTAGATTAVVLSLRKEKRATLSLTVRVSQ